MGLSSTIRKQFGNPSGWSGYLVGWILATKNRQRVDWAVKMLNAQPADKILEIGCGPGVAVQQIASRLTTGNITAIDRSAVMIAMAMKRNKKLMSSGKIIFQNGLLQNMNFPAHYYDKIFASNVTLFWQNPVAELQTIRKNLAEGGKFYIFHQPPMTTDKDSTRQFAEKTCADIEQAAFKVVEVKYGEMNPVPVVCIICQPK
jgi:ubiquinone/menaquinone biosynthesis C-methylase UbiE